MTTCGKTNERVLLREPSSDTLNHRQSFSPIARDTVRTRNIGIGRPRNDEGTISDSTAEEEPGNASVQHNLGSAYYEMGDLGRARATLLRYIAISPDGEKAGEVHFILACIEAAQSRIEECLREMQLAIDKGVDNPNTYLNEGSFRKLQDDPRFQEKVRKLIRKN